MDSGTLTISGSSKRLKDMIDSVVHEQIQRYLDGEISVSEIYRWAFDQIPPYIEDDVDTTKPNPSALSFLVFACCEYDLCRDYLGWSDARAEAEFRELLTEHIASQSVKAS